VSERKAELREGGYGDSFSGTVRRTVLPGGLRVVTESLPQVRSAAFGIWAGVGSRDEAPPLSGASHFLEHLLFKGTPKRTALEISAAIDAVGGEMNAFTAKEYTCYYARVLDDDLALAVDVVTDMVTASVIDPADVETERGVILEEIAMHDDDPGDVVHDVVSQALFGEHPLGRPVIGTGETITAMARDAIADFYRDRYTPDALVVAAAGNLDHDTVVAQVRDGFARRLADALPQPIRPADTDGVPVLQPDVRVVNKETEQAHLVLALRGIHRHDDRRFALAVLNNALGGGMSSRLFQEIREKRGLAYSVYSYSSQYADAGLFGVYAGCSPDRADEVLRLIREQLEEVASKGLADDEVLRGKGQAKGGLVLGLEDTGSRMSRVGKGELAYGDILEVDEIIRRIDVVTPDDIRQVAAELLTGPLSLGAIGPFGDHDFTAILNGGG
jgi:predicted Zn-dependent peptidase